MPFLHEMLARTLIYVDQMPKSSVKLYGCHVRFQKKMRCTSQTRDRKMIFKQKMEHALRDYARNEFGRALGLGVTARNCERSVYNWAVQETRHVSDDPSWENRLFRWRYKQKAFGLIKELERAPVIVPDLQVTGEEVKLKLNFVPQLARRLQLKELESKNLARYSAEVLWPDGPAAQTAYELKRRDLVMEAAKAREEDYTGLFTCRRCKTKRTTFYLLQTRAADEPMTVFITCMSCGNKWKG